MKKLWLLLIPVIVLMAFAALRRSAPPEIPFTRVTRETIVSTLTTNGKVEPIEFSAVRAEAAGAVEHIYVDKGQSVAQGQLLLRQNPGQANAALSGAEARIAQSQAELETISNGGSAREIAQIDSGLASARSALSVAQKDYDALSRLKAKGAATQTEVDAAKNAVDRSKLDIEALEHRRTVLVTANDRSAAEARVREAESSAASAKVSLAMAQVHSPISGVLYAFDVKPGAYLNPGDQIGAVGRLDRMRVTVYVDEPELGRVAKGMPVTITWDALPGRSWKGTVERTPTQVSTLGTRQVGEVTVVVENPDHTLIPGTNVNAEIRSSVAQNAVTIPKEVLRRQGTVSGVFKLVDDKIHWQPVKLGVASVATVQVLEGLAPEDAVALPFDNPLKDGDSVRPVFP
jgi:HlyD family secretion protein